MSGIMGQVEVTLGINEEGFVVCPVCGEELRGSGVKYFSGATITLNPFGPGYTYTTESVRAGSSDLERIHCSMCSWSLELTGDVTVRIEKA